jgi:hypothetical protein
MVNKDVLKLFKRRSRKYFYPFYIDVTKTSFLQNHQNKKEKKVKNPQDHVFQDFWHAQM